MRSIIRAFFVGPSKTGQSCIIHVLRSMSGHSFRGWGGRSHHSLISHFARRLYMYSYYEYVRSMTVVMTWRLSNILVGRGDAAADVMSGVASIVMTSRRILPITHHCKTAQTSHSLFSQPTTSTSPPNPSPNDSSTCHIAPPCLGRSRLRCDQPCVSRLSRRDPPRSPRS